MRKLYSAPFVIAHRGVSEYCPENTLPAFEYLFEKEDCEMEGIETDVQLSKDGIPVLFHDRTLKRIAGVEKKVSELTLDELKRLDFGAWFNSSFKGEHIVTLDEFLSRYGKKIDLYIEIKARKSEKHEINIELTEKVLEMICKKNLQERVRILSFNKEILFHASKISNAIRYVLNIEDTPAIFDSFFKENYWISGYGVDINIVSEELLSKAHEYGKSIFPFVCNTSSQADSLRRLGVDGLFSNDPFFIQEHFRSNCES